jgi:hypothetical protein
MVATICYCCEDCAIPPYESPDDSAAPTTSAARRPSPLGSQSTVTTGLCLPFLAPWCVAAGQWPGRCCFSPPASSGAGLKQIAKIVTAFSLFATGRSLMPRRRAEQVVGTLAFSYPPPTYHRQGQPRPPHPATATHTSRRTPHCQRQRCQAKLHVN